MAAYDFIVVGAGSAGCAVAGRLASESSSTVLLIEAGGSGRGLAVKAPLAGIRQWGSALDWSHETEPEAECAGRRIVQHRGRMLGGTSAMNAMAWVRGSDLDYDSWQLPGWSWPDVAPVFERIERGPIRVGRTPYPDELSLRFVASARAAGVAATDDISGPGLDGAAIGPVNIHNGERWSAARGYLDGQNNLTVATKAEVRRLVIRDGRAVGVEYRRGGRARQDFAGEIVLSAGCFGTPQLLQLSGVGPAEHLRSVGITPLVDSPRVGRGLTDHPHVWITCALAPGHIGLADAANPKWLVQWLFRRTGKLANSGVEALAHIRLFADSPAADMQLIFAPGDANADPKRRRKFEPAISVGMSYWTPASRGDVMVRSPDPSVPPAIRLNLLSERSDIEALKRGIERSRDILATDPLACAVEAETLPGAGADLEAYIRDTVTTTYHSSCSAAMGSDLDSVLDEELRVRGVENLRVADASALPRIPRANTNAPSIMVGERCADLLLAR